MSVNTQGNARRKRDSIVRERICASSLFDAECRHCFIKGNGWKNIYGTMTMWGSSNVIDVYIRYLRKKIDDGQEEKLIHTVRGAGYVLKVKE